MADPDGLYVTDHLVPPVSVDGAERRPGPAPAGPSGERPLVVLVHGSLDRGTSFTRVLRRLPGYHVVTYDRRGYQRSRFARPPGDEDAHTVHVADLLAIVDTHRSPGQPTVVVGHSYGGSIALGAALADPGAVRAVGAYEPPLPWLPFWPGHGTPPASVAPDPGETAERFFRRMVGDDAWERLGERGRAERRADGPALVAEMAAIRRGSPPYDPGALTVPAVLGYGERTVPHHRDGVLWLAERIPTAEVVSIPGAAHGAHLSHPDAFAALVHLTVTRAVQRAGERT